MIDSRALSAAVSELVEHLSDMCERDFYVQKLDGKLDMLGIIDNPLKRKTVVDMVKKMSVELSYNCELIGHLDVLMKSSDKAAFSNFLSSVHTSLKKKNEE